MPRVKLTPTEEQRRTVRSFSAYGVEPDDIAKYIGVSEKTLQKYYGKDIFRARVEANLKVGKALLTWPLSVKSRLRPSSGRRRAAVFTRSRTARRAQLLSPISWWLRKKRPPEKVVPETLSDPPLGAFFHHSGSATFALPRHTLLMDWAFRLGLQGPAAAPRKRRNRLRS
jgi:hypothetical protein